MRDTATLLYLPLSCLTLVLVCSAACGWNSVLFGWRSIGQSLSRYLLGKLARLGLLLCLGLALLVLGYFLAVAVDETTDTPFASGVVLASTVVPMLAAVCVAIVWWTGELAGYLTFRLASRSSTAADRLKAS
jgi:hypothetical protein